MCTLQEAPIPHALAVYETWTNQQKLKEREREKKRKKENQRKLMIGREQMMFYCVALLVDLSRGMCGVGSAVCHMNQGGGLGEL